MARIEEKKRSDAGKSAIVRWRLGRTRSGGMQTETFGAAATHRTRLGPKASGRWWRPLASTGRTAG
jgi:hypothetical protein